MAPQSPPSSAPLLVALLGALGLAGGSFLPWVEVVSIFGTISVDGMSGDGKLTAGAGALAALLYGITLLRWNASPGQEGPTRSMVTAGAVFSALGAAVAFYDYMTVSDRISGADSEGVVAQVGTGLYLCCAGGIVGVIAGVVAVGRIPNEVQQAIERLR